jgi:dihydrofolate reductase
MRKIILAMSVSLDGYMAGPNGELDWQLVDEELHDHFNEQLRDMSAFLDGRVSYELMAAYWPTADEDPEASRPVREFAEIWREMPKIVYSRTLESAGWHATIAREVVPAEIEKLKAEPGGDMAIGGANLAATFLRHDLVDEIRLYVNPIVLGAGQPLFKPADKPINLHLADTHTFTSGVVLLHYRR